MFTPFRLRPKSRSALRRRRALHRSHRLEQLEDRRMLTIDITIADISYNESNSSAIVTVTLSEEPGN